MTKDGGTGITEICVDELAGNYLVAVECLSVGEVGIGLASVGRGVVPL